MTEKQNINEFNREELVDILRYLYIQGDGILDAKARMSTIVQNTINLRLKQATTAKYNRNGHIGGIVFALMGAVNLFNNFFYGLLTAVVMYGFGQVTTRLFTWFLARPTNTNHSVGGVNFTIKVLSNKQVENVTQEATIEAENTDEYKMIVQDKQDLETNPTFTYFLSLIPQNFANLIDFSGMLVLLEDFRATNFQEAANLWRTEQHQQALSQQQQKMAQQLQQSNAQLSQLRQQAEQLRKGQMAAHDAAARANAQTAKVNEKLANIERYGVHANIRG